MRRILISFGVTVIAANGWCQGIDPAAPPQRMPKTLEPKASGKAKPVLKSRRDPEGDEIFIPELKGIIIVTNRAAIVSEGVTPLGGVDVRDIELLQRKDFAPVVAPFLGQPISQNRIRDLEDAIILYCRKKNRPLVDVILPPQEIKHGVIQLWFLEGRVGKVVVENEDRDWFSTNFVRKQIRAQPGDYVDTERLLSDLDWINRNPFRQANVTFKQGERLGESDILIKVDDRLPFRVYAGYEDSGTRFTGEHRFLTGFNWGKAFGLDHQLNYQYTTDAEFDFVTAHSASYQAALPWRHILTVIGSYVDARADFSEVAPGTDAGGESYQASMRYSIPLSPIGKYQHEISVGADFKRSDNDLEFGGTTVSSSDTDIIQFQAGYSSLYPDEWGQTSLGLEGYYSPGDLTDKNSTEAFLELRPGTDAQYYYGRVSVERITRLPWDFALVTRGAGQVASERLLPSEHLGIGGYKTVRGYDERLGNGDEGWMFSLEARTPSLHLGNLLGTPRGEDFLQFLAFYDYGSVSILDAESGEDAHVNLSSVGAGLRYAISKNFSLRFDYGFQLSERDLSDDNSRSHIAALLSF